MKYLFCFLLIFGCQKKVETTSPNTETLATDSPAKSPTLYFQKTLRDCLDGQMEKAICFETLEFHLANGANINGLDDSMLALPPVHWAILGNNKEMFDFLIAKGAGVNTKSEGKIYPGMTPIAFIKHLEKDGRKFNPLMEEELKRKGGR